MIDVNKIMLQLGIGHKETVYMSVSPIAGLEIIKVDTASKTVVSYANRPLEYNETLRNLADYDAFKTAVQELFKELQINPQCNVVLNLPTVLFARKEVPLILDNDAVREFLISEAEQTYTFKRHDPQIAWIDGNVASSNEVRPLFYSALQQDVIDNIKNALSEIGATLISITTSLCSIINALAFSGHIEKMIKDNMTWNLILLTNSGYSVCAMQGANIVDYYEDIIALQALDEEEQYKSIISSLNLVFMSYPSNFTYIVSNTNLISAKIVFSKLKDMDIPAEYMENNIYKQEDIIPVSLEILQDVGQKITLEAIGTAISNHSNLPVKIDFLDGLQKGAAEEDNSPIKITIGGNEYEFTQQKTMLISAIICVILIVPIFLLSIIFSALSSKLQTNLETLNEEAKKLETEIKNLSEFDSKSGTFNEKQEITKIVEYNRAKLMAYSALGECVPEDLWITYFYTRKDGQIDIKGKALSVEDISIFYKNLKDSLIKSKIRLYKLEMAANNIDDAVTSSKQSYVFEITNMSEAELSNKDVEVSTEPKNEQENTQNTDTSSKSKKREAAQRQIKKK